MDELTSNCKCVRRAWADANPESLRIYAAGKRHSDDRGRDVCKAADRAMQEKRQRTDADGGDDEGQQKRQRIDGSVDRCARD